VKVMHLRELTLCKEVVGQQRSRKVLVVSNAGLLLRLP
jgi:hypothetical protein